MDDEPTGADVVKEAIKAFTRLGGDFRRAFEDHFEEAQYRIDKELAKALSKHPDVAVELKRTVRKTRRAVDKWLGEWGLR